MPRTPIPAADPAPAGSPRPDAGIVPCSLGELFGYSPLQGRADP